MRRLSLIVLRFGLGATFILIGVLIFMDPMGWGSMIQPWAARLLPVSLTLTMQTTAAMDIAVGLMLLFGLWTWIAAGLGFIHLLTVMSTVRRWMKPRPAAIQVQRPNSSIRPTAMSMAAVVCMVSVSETGSRRAAQGWIIEPQPIGSMKISTPMRMNVAPRPKRRTMRESLLMR